jgi:septal ring factor EnvC (AmiA/AmiB activator)
MAETKSATLAIICIVLAVGVVGAVVMLNQAEAEIQVKTGQIAEMQNENNNMQEQISSLQTETTTLSSQVSGLESQVSSLQTETSNLQDQKSTLENEKVVLETQISELQSEKTALETQVSDKQTEITSLNNDVSKLEGQVSSLQEDVVFLENEVTESYNTGYAEGESEGYGQGFDEGFAEGMEFLTESGYYLRDPTYEEAVAFIASDLTDLNPYTQSYVCYDFTADFIANAQNSGYRCGFVYMEFSSSAHAIACFNTADQGLIYVEPQNDNLVSVAVGQPYLSHMILDLGIIW